MHSNEVEHLPRRFGMMVTCNATEPYLKGADNEDTRWLPVLCHGKIDFKAVRKELPQILAQAKFLYEFDNDIPRLTQAELVMQRIYLKPRQIIHEWDDGFTMDEMLGWCQNESWFATKNRTFHRTEITKVLKLYFKIDSIVRAIPIFYQTEGGAKAIRKWRYWGEINWNTFIDGLED
jgi:hypothetical protein